MPAWLHELVAYFLGQGILGSAFVLLGVAGRFSPEPILALLLPGAAASLYFMLRSASEARRGLRHALQAWRAAAVAWRLIALLLVLVTGLGIMTLGGALEGDPVAFYMVIAKVMAASHRLVPLTGYEDFSSVGLLAEALLASLMALGMPGVSSRILSWFNYLPTLLILYGLARQCGLSRRGGLIAAVMASTSTAVLFLWGCGKTDLFAVGPAVAACLLALRSWDRPSRRSCLALAGLLAGFACVYKLTYLVPLVPAVALIIAWPEAMDAVAALRTRTSGVLKPRFLSVLRAGTIFGAGFAAALVPHVLKNLVILGTFLGSQSTAPFYSPATTARIVLSYPLALTFGNYWAQFGTLSPLVLAFAPMLAWLPRPVAWRDSRLGALGWSAAIGLALWVILFPSIFMPRYFLATLLLLGIPVAAAADGMTRQPGTLSLVVAGAVGLTLAATPLHTYKLFPIFSPARTLSASIAAESDCRQLTGQWTSYCEAHTAINGAAAHGERVLLLSYYRFWLRPDLLQAANSSGDRFDVSRYKETFWGQLKDNRFGFILVDQDFVKMDKEFLDSPPRDIVTRELFRAGRVAAYKIEYREE
jgi:hypothetical protein